MRLQFLILVVSFMATEAARWIGLIRPGCEPYALGRWMAHYVADLIAKAENATGEEGSLNQKKCFDAILALWMHRAAFPSGKRPFEEMEPVVRAIESLDPEDSTPRYFRSARAPKAEGREDSES